MLDTLADLIVKVISKLIERHPALRKAPPPPDRDAVQKALDEARRRVGLK